jgi:EPS-associated MarR family transcriptional regulator
MVSRQTQLQEDTYFRVLRILEGNAEINQRELARRLGISLGGLNYCLKALVEKGLVRPEHVQGSNHKLKYAYTLTERGAAERACMASRVLQRKLAEYKALEVEIRGIKLELRQSTPLAPERLNPQVAEVPSVQSPISKSGGAQASPAAINY